MSRNRGLLGVAFVAIIIVGVVVWKFVLNAGVFGGLHQIAITDRDKEQLLGVQVSPNGAYALVYVNGREKDSLRMYDTANAKLRWELFEAPWRKLIGFTSDSTQYIASGMTNVSADEPDQIWYINSASGDVEQTIILQADENPLAANDMYYVASIDETLTIYDKASGDVYFQHEVDGEINWGQITLDGETLLVASAARQISGYNFYLIDLNTPAVTEPTFTGENLARINETSTRISSDGRYLAFAISNHRGLFVIDLQTREPVYNVFSDQLTSEDGGTVELNRLFGFMLDNTYFVYLTNGDIMYAVNLSTGQIDEQFDLGYQSSSLRMAISADESRIAIINRDRLAIWGR